MPTACGTPAVRYQHRAASATARITTRMAKSTARKEEGLLSADIQVPAKDTIVLHYDRCHGARVHDRRRGRIPDRRSGHVGAAVARLGAADLERPRARRSDQARAAPVD